MPEVWRICSRVAEAVVAHGGPYTDPVGRCLMECILHFTILRMAFSHAMLQEKWMEASL